MAFRPPTMQPDVSVRSRLYVMPLHTTSEATST